MLQMTEDTNTQSYTWDGNVAFADNNAYLQDELGSPIRFIDNMGATIDSYGYDEFGVDLYSNQGMAQPFGYTGYTTDIIAGTYFAQAREYVPSAGRFGSEDLIRGYTSHPSTFNKYVYCLNQPIDFIDLNGLERVVVTGGYYNENPDKEYQYEFIDSGLREVGIHGGTLLIADIWVTEQDKARIEHLQVLSAFQGARFDVVYFNSIVELSDYINYGSDGNRENNPITHFSLFAHGTPNTIHFGTTSQPLSWHTTDIEKIYPSAFRSSRASNHSVFYSCNTGTIRDGTSFAQVWSNRTGGTTRAVVNGTTSYWNINDPARWRLFSNINRLLKKWFTNDYNTPGAAILPPVASDGVKWEEFRPCPD